jgi:lipoprotein signal peptidase
VVADGHRHHLDRRRLVTPAAAGAGWCGFAGYVIWQGTTGRPLVWPDTTSYTVVARHPLWSTGFWAGQRPPLVPLLMKAAGATSGFTATQSVIAAISWGLLAFTVGRLLPPGWRRVVAIWVMVAFATSTPIVLWNRSVLSESLSLSFLALLVASIIWTARRVTWPRMAAVWITGLAFAAARDAQVWTVALLGLVVAVVAVVRAWRQRRFPRRIATLALGLLAAAGLTGSVVAHTGRADQNVVDVLVVRIFPFPDRVAWFAAHGMPQVGAIDQLAAVTQPLSPGTAEVVGFDPTDPAFRPLEGWIRDHGQSTYLLWLVTHPGYVITEPFVRPEAAYNYADGRLTFYAATDRVDSPLTTVLWPAWWWLLPLTAVGVGAAAITGSWREHGWQVVMVLGALGVVAMLIAWQGDGEEVTRHTIEGFAEVRISVLVVAVVGVLRATDGPGRWWAGGGGRRAGAARPGPGADAGSDDGGTRRDGSRSARRRDRVSVPDGPGGGDRE